MKLPRIALKYARVTVTATLANGSPATLAGVDFAVVGYRSAPDQFTVWTASSYSAGVATVLMVGPDVAVLPAGAIRVAEPGGDLWARVVDNPEIDAALIEPIDLI